ncbi:hypothetical protein EPUS_06120 [Endocarpon pusillum Z07020]|uniref:Uncharacterized protein n=1 Tax=Endocarpon pusillum (strain Z07020 / HMAS-L-300199) TaxID=1263415 RepID=U1I366_ENDPU|nr:uncharacterized protein EPUS_06120 [Endocarpon pusillum Z07020]ERF76459.1 hypothetical protein EPUS_06120 [Endocarpon pusillum Z07020]
MSGALVPTGGGNFQQSGQLDWVSLSKSTITFGFDVLVRLSKAELNPATVIIGRIACNRFVIKAEAQKRIYDALSSLKSFSSYGKLVWFGFGIKSTIKDLADTEHGMACVALCACMSISYDSFYVAEVLREFCKYLATPPDLVPSVHQWKVLVGMCAGSVSNSKFPTLLEGLIRLVHSRAELSFQRPTSREALAKAIRALADVSNGKLANITIAGGLDCMWLAAISEWLLALDVEIRLGLGDTVYRSSTHGHRCSSAVTIIFISDNEPSIQLTKCYVVPKGLKFIRDPEPDQPSFKGGRSEWAKILSDTFGRHLDSLLKGTMQHSFAFLLFNASRLAEGCYRYGPMQRSTQLDSAEHSFPFRRFNFSHSLARGQAFLDFASKQVPELAAIINTLDQAGMRNYTNAIWEESIDRITLESVLAVFSGSKSSWASVEKEPSALSYDGICVYFKALEDLNLSPEEASIVRVVAGLIDFEGVKYERINDLVADAGISEGDYGPHVSYNLLVQEAPQHGEGHDEVVEILLTRGAELDPRDKNGQTPLSRAAGNGFKTTVKLMIECSAQLDSKDNSGQTPLALAATLNHIAVVDRLIQEKADVNAAAAAEGGRTALQAAAEGGHLAVVERLIQEKADVNAAAAAWEGRTALQAAAGAGQLTVVKRLIQEKADVNAAAAKYGGGRTALQAAAGAGQLTVVKRLIQEKADVNAAAAEGGRTALQAAAEGGHLVVVKRLIQEKANVNAAAAGYGGRTALQAAAEGGHLAIVERLKRRPMFNVVGRECGAL